MASQEDPKALTMTFQEVPKDFREMTMDERFAWAKQFLEGINPYKAAKTTTDTP